MASTDEDDGNNEQGEQQQQYDFDEILQHLGQFGRSQLQSFLWLCFPAMFTAIAIMSYIFTGKVPQYR